MSFVDRAARWDPVPDERPCRVWLPAPLAAPLAHPETAAPTREPRSITITLTREQADDLPLEIPPLLDQHQVRPGDRVTIDLGGLRSIHLTGLELLLTVLWRRVGAHGEVLLTGGAPGLRAQLDCLGLTAARCRAAVHGTPPAPPGAPGPVLPPSSAATGAAPLASLVPWQRHGVGPGLGSDVGADARPAPVTTSS